MEFFIVASITLLYFFNLKDRKRSMYSIGPIKFCKSNFAPSEEDAEIEAIKRPAQKDQYFFLGERIFLRVLTMAIAEFSTSLVKPSPKSIVWGWMASRATLAPEVLLRYPQRIWRGNVCMVIGGGALFRSSRNAMLPPGLPSEVASITRIWVGLNSNISWL